MLRKSGPGIEINLHEIRGKKGKSKRTQGAQGLKGEIRSKASGQIYIISMNILSYLF